MRVLSKEEQLQVLNRISEINRMNRQSTYAGLLIGISGENRELYKGLVNLLIEKDSIDDERDEIENRAYLSFVPQNILGVDLTDDQIDGIAKIMQKMKPLGKVNLIAEHSVEARDSGEINLVEDMKRAMGNKKKAEQTILDGLEKIKKLFEDRIKSTEIKELKIEFNRIKVMIERTVRDMEMTLEKRMHSEETQGRVNGIAQGIDTYVGTKNGLQFQDKSQRVLYGVNEFLSKEDILAYVKAGKLEQLIDAKKEAKTVGDGGEIGVFNEKIDQLLERLAPGEIVGTRWIDKAVKVVMRNRVGNRRLEEIEAELNELYSKEGLTTDEQEKLLYIQLLVLRNIKGHNILRRLPFLKKRTTRMEDIAIGISNFSRMENRKKIKNRRFMNEILVARGETPLNLIRETDLTVVRCDGTTTLDDIGNSSKYR